MLIQFLVDRPGAWEEQNIIICGTSYKFKRNSNGCFVCNIANEEHAKWATEQRWRVSFREYVDNMPKIVTENNIRKKAHREGIQNT